MALQNPASLLQNSGTKRVVTYPVPTATAKLDFGETPETRPLTDTRLECQILSFPIGATLETLLGRPLEVEVRDSVDKALKILKQKMSKEGILQEIKRRRYYEKPSVKRKRKMREARKRRRREAKRRIIR